MLNRRLIRVKVFQALYAYVQDDQPSLNKSKSYLKESIAGIHKNFLTVFIFPFELVHYIRTHHDPRANKYLANDDASRLYDALSLRGGYEHFVSNPEIKKTIERPPYAWQKNQELLRSVYRKLAEDEATQKLLATDFTQLEHQFKFISRIYDFLKDLEEFDQAMEEIEMLWEDEKIPVYKAIRNLMQEVREEGVLNLPEPDDKDTEGQQYANDLLTQATRNMEEYAVMIDQNAPGWDRERIAKADMILMTLALTELIHFPYIPVKVTLNEYLELAKNYSTPQSSKFVNGVLDKLVAQLKAENRIAKKGRGMIE